MKWPGVVFGIAALVLLIVGAVLVGNTASFVSRSTVTTGTVVDHESRMHCSRANDDRETRCKEMQHPVIVFETARGEEIRFTSDVGTSTAMHAAGEQVQVRYLADRPHDAEIDGFRVWLAPAIVAGLGIVFGLVSAGLLIGHFRRARPGVR